MKSLFITLAVSAAALLSAPVAHAQVTGPVGDPFANIAAPEEPDSVIKASTIDEQLEKKAYNAGVTLMEQGDLDAALEQFDEAIRLYPEYAEAYTNKGSIRWRQGEYAQAIEDFNNSIAISPSADAYFGLGQCYYEQNQHDNAIMAYTDALRLDKNYSHAAYYRGGLYFEKGEYEKAIADYDQAIRADSKYA
ncbi:MAG: tetratricopeptide repeat protein [Bacteroidales bacterium]|nr:tetratricopeptide repeat protein [Bacteroidales bacterium]